jgi:hypothetical protein
MSKLTSRILRTGVIAGLALSASQAYAACTFGGSGEPSLQTTFDGLLGADTVNVAACIADGADAIWSTAGQIGTVEIYVELSGNASSNTFGIYDPANGNQIRIFEGNDSSNVLGIIQVSQLNGLWRARVRDSNVSGAEGTGWGAYSPLSSSAFGFYLGTAANGTFYSETSKNTDGVDHMYAYGPLGGDFQGEHIIAWEDLFNGQDRDYQDFVATLQDITPVPLPTAVWLLGSGLIGLAGVSRRRS